MAAAELLTLVIMTVQLSTKRQELFEAALRYNNVMRIQYKEYVGWKIMNSGL